MGLLDPLPPMSGALKRKASTALCARESEAELPQTLQQPGRHFGGFAGRGGGGASRGFEGACSLIFFQFVLGKGALRFSFRLPLQP